MGIEEAKAAVKELSPEERRKIALYVLELEKEHIQKNVGPKISEELDNALGVIQDGIEKLRKYINRT
ncbi:hypothetical protein FBQ87_08295 [Sphingobacteriales bacterium CHB3]|nr:hypothetical protein [Sphingobacteriales bacterium CHB3]